MSFKRYTGSAWTDPANIKRWTGSAWQEVGFVRRWDGSAWQDVWPLAPSVSASLTTRSVSASALSPSSATCYYRLDDNGNVYGGSSTTNLLEVWRDVGSNPDFDALFEKISGATPAATNITYGQWMSGMSVDRTMSLGRSSIGTTEAVIDVSIRDAATQTVLTTARITMQAIVFSF